MPFTEFLPFKMEEKEPMIPSSALSLFSPGVKTPSPESSSGVGFNLKRDSRILDSSTTSVQSNLQPKKQRRCWSSELHTRFINALQELGGLQGEMGVWRDKRIRENQNKCWFLVFEKKKRLRKIKRKVGLKLVILEIRTSRNFEVDIKIFGGMHPSK